MTCQDFKNVITDFIRSYGYLGPIRILVWIWLIVTHGTWTAAAKVKLRQRPRNRLSHWWNPVKPMQNGVWKYYQTISQSFIACSTWGLSGLLDCPVNLAASISALSWMLATWTGSAGPNSLSCWESKRVQAETVHLVHIISMSKDRRSTQIGSLRQRPGLQDIHALPSC